jgi:hypothetical protein
MLTVIVVGGCAGAAPVFELRTAGGYSYLTVSVEERDLQAALQTALASANPVWLLNPIIDLRRGEIAFSGDLRDDQGNLTPIALTVRLFATNGRLGFAVDYLKLGGLELRQDALTGLNQGIAEGVQKAPISDTKIDNLTISDTTLSVRFKSPRGGAEGTNPTFQLTSDANFAYLTVTLTEADLVNIAASIPGANNQPLLNAPIVKLNNGVITITGTLRQNGAASSTTINAGVLNGLPSFVVTSVVSGGWTADAAALAQINTDIARGIAQGFANSSVQVTSLIVQNGTLSIGFRAPLR